MESPEAEDKHLLVEASVFKFILQTMSSVSNQVPFEDMEI